MQLCSLLSSNFLLTTFLVCWLCTVLELTNIGEADSRIDRFDDVNRNAISWTSAAWKEPELFTPLLSV
jgi:hypothetical protein